MGYLSFPFDAPDPDELLLQALSRIQELFPSWTPRETHLEYAVLAEKIRLEVDTRQLVADVADDIFRTYGTDLLRLPDVKAAAATGQVVFNLSTDAGATIPAGTQVVWSDAGGNGYLFQVQQEVAIAAGVRQSPPATVVAVEPGVAPNALPVGLVELIDAIAFVTTVQGVTSPSGGADAESDEEYLDRLAELLVTVRVVPFHAEDFAVIAKTVPGVARALALDGYDPGSDTFGHEKTVTVVPIDEQGLPVPAATAAAVDAKLQSEREVNFVVHVAEPTYSPLSVEVTARPVAGADPVQLAADIQAAVLLFLAPATWGGGDARPPRWDPTSTVRYLKLAGLIDRVPNLAHVEVLELNNGTSDVVLPGAAALPAPPNHPTTPTTVTVTVL